MRRHIFLSAVAVMMPTSLGRHSNSVYDISQYVDVYNGIQYAEIGMGWGGNALLDLKISRDGFPSCVLILLSMLMVVLTLSLIVIAPFSPSQQLHKERHHFRQLHIVCWRQWYCSCRSVRSHQRYEWKPTAWNKNIAKHHS